MAFANGPKNKIYRGSVEQNQPIQVEALAAAAGVKPGMLVQYNSSGKLAAHTTAAAYYIAKEPMHQSVLTYAYKLDETLFAYTPRSRDYYLAFAAIGVVGPKDTPLTTNGDGYLKVAGTDDPVVGFLDQVVSPALTVATLVDIRIP